MSQLSKELKKKGLYSGSMKISNSYGWGEVKNGERIQKVLMQFTTNQRNLFRNEKTRSGIKESFKLL